MRNEKKESLNKGREFRKIIASLKMGMRFIILETSGRITFLVACFLLIVGYYYTSSHWLRLSSRRIPEFIDANEYWGLYTAFSVITLLVIVYLFGFPIYNHFKVENAFRRIGLVNKADEPPFIIYQPHHLENGLWNLLFDTTGIPLSVWEDRKEEIETALNVKIADIQRGDRLNNIILSIVPLEMEPRGEVPWSNNVISEKDSVIALGRSLIGIEYADLDVVSHALIAGSTGSGKSVMLKSILFQLLKNNAYVILVDFKGGANFTKVWRDNTDFVTDEPGLKEKLDLALSELNYRKKVFAQYECENIKAFNDKTGSNMERIIIAFDEVAECFDKNGLSTETKKEVMELERKVAAIARLGRAFGIHLILGLQRPDATVITGQIKSNIDLRMCGRSDDVLSQIVLDNTDAAREIGENDRGKFMLSNGHLIQGFHFKDEDFIL